MKCRHLAKRNRWRLVVLLRSFFVYSPLDIKRVIPRNLFAGSCLNSNTCAAIAHYALGSAICVSSRLACSRPCRGYALLRYIRRKQREAAAAKSAGKSSKGAERKGGEEDDADADFIPAEYYSGFDIRPFPVRGAAGQKGNKGPGAKSASSSSSSSSTEPHASKDACAWMEVKKGGPAVLRAFSSHSLFLCYPDEFTSASPQSLALAALNAYKGNTVIVAGELLETGTLLENPWGRACDGEFQQQLRATFHKVLQVPLPSWPGSIDALTVWRRTELCEVDDMTFKNIPEAERISLEAAAPCCRQFLSPK